MTITLGPVAVDIDGAAATGGYSYDLGDGRVLHASGGGTIAEGDEATFVVRDLGDGSELVAPTVVHSEQDAGSTDVFAAQGLSDGGFRLHYSRTTAVINFGGEGPQFTRDFDADGTPRGAATAVPGDGQFFTSRNTVHELLSSGDIVLAHDLGITVLAPDGSVRGGVTAELSFASTSNGYSITETADGFLVVETKPGDFPGASAAIRGRFYAADGTPRGEAFDIVADPVQPPTANYTIGSSRLDVDTLANGDFVVVYADLQADADAGGPVEGGISAVILNADGTVKTGPFLANPSETAGRQTYPVVDALDDGGFLVTYSDSSTVENRSVFTRVQRFDADGTALGEAAFNKQDFFTRTVVQNPSQTVIQPDGTGLVIGEFGFALTIGVSAAPPPPPKDLRGDEEANELIGDDRDNRIEGLEGNDTLVGGTGDDTLIGGEGSDTLDGGDGSDVYFVDRFDTVVETAGAAGFDEVRTAVRLAIPDGVEQLTAVGTGDIRLDGRAGDEILVGNAGDNLLVSFGGNDTVTGGGGADVFVLTGRGGVAPNLTITDWGVGDDQLAIDDQLLGIGGRGIDRRPLTKDVFRDLRESDSVAYNARTGELRIDVDGDGDRELVATLEGGARLTLDDVFLF